MGVSDSCDRECYRYAGPSPSSVLGQVFAFTLPITSVQDRLSACDDTTRKLHWAARVGQATRFARAGMQNDKSQDRCWTSEHCSR